MKDIYSERGAVRCTILFRTCWAAPGWPKTGRTVSSPPPCPFPRTAASSTFSPPPWSPSSPRRRRRRPPPSRAAVTSYRRKHLLHCLAAAAGLYIYKDTHRLWVGFYIFQPPWNVIACDSGSPTERTMAYIVLRSRRFLSAAAKLAS